MGSPALENIHPSLWRGSQLSRATGKVVDTGYPVLAAELPGGGWPRGALIELLVQQGGVGEIRLLAPALAAAEKRPIALLQPPYVPNALGLGYVVIPPDRLMLLKAAKTADVLWSAEQVLKAGSCHALIMWQQHIRTDSLRRLHLAAQTSETLFFIVRPLAAAQDPSPAELRLAVRPGTNGTSIDILKRKGPSVDGSLLVDLLPSPVLSSPHGRSRRATGTGVVTEPSEAEQRHRVEHEA